MLRTRVFGSGGRDWVIGVDRPAGGGIARTTLVGRGGWEGDGGIGWWCVVSGGGAARARRGPGSVGWRIARVRIGREGGGRMLRGCRRRDGRRGTRRKRTRRGRERERRGRERERTNRMAATAATRGKGEKGAVCCSLWARKKAVFAPRLPPSLPPTAAAPLLPSRPRPRPRPLFPTTTAALLAIRPAPGHGGPGKPRPISSPDHQSASILTCFVPSRCSTSQLRVRRPSQAPSSRWQLARPSRKRPPTAHRPPPTLHRSSHSSSPSSIASATASSPLHSTPPLPTHRHLHLPLPSPVDRKARHRSFQITLHRP
jgi:hypothetical protein